MSYYVLHDASGRIVQSGSTAPGRQPPQVVGLTTLPVDFPVKPGDAHVANGALEPGILDLRTVASRMADKWAEVRTERDALLANTDWVAIKQAEVGGPLAKPWREYRQFLRDITLQADPFNIIWPEKPA